MAKLIDLTGKFFGEWEVIQRAKKNTSYGNTRWTCFCSCGKAKEVEGSSLVLGKSTNCGCIATKNKSKELTTHGLTGTVEFRIWNSMLSRCYYEGNSSFMFYGGRGIKVCDRWVIGENGKHPLICFIEDMGLRPTSNHSIERENVNGNYEPNNCKWVTPDIQFNNRRSSKFIEIDGKIKTQKQWLDVYNIKKTTYFARLRSGMAPIEALKLPLRNK